MRKLDIILLALLALLLALVAAALVAGKTAPAESPDPESLTVHPPREEPPTAAIEALASAPKTRRHEITAKAAKAEAREKKPVKREAEPAAAVPWTLEDVEYLARTMWGEARGCTVTEQAAVAWCVLNRVDDSRFPCTVRDVVTAPYQFAGYLPENPVDVELAALAVDVLSWWYAGDDTGRVLPREYLYFSGDGVRNIYTTEYHGGAVWDWSIDSIYGEERNV